MGYEDQLVAHVHVSWANPKKVRQLTLVGSGMRLLFDDMDTSAPVKVFKTPTQLPSHSTSDGGYQSFIADQLAVGDTYFPAVKSSEPLKDQVFDFLRCAKEGKQPVSGARFGADVVRVLEAIQISVKRNGAKVKVQSHESLTITNIPLVDL